MIPHGAEIVEIGLCASPVRHDGHRPAGLSKEIRGVRRKTGIHSGPTRFR